MSLVPTYVQSTSGKWYKDPVIRSDNWFVCWDDDEPIELVIAEGGPSPEEVIAYLNDRGWAVERYHKHQGRLLGRMFNGKMRPSAGAWWLKQESGPPDDLMAGEGLDEWSADCVLYPNGRIGG
jgi:hypothetical protein